MLRKDLKPGEEIFCDYGYLDHYMRMTTIFDTVMAIGKFVSHNDQEQFKENMKAGIQLVRSYAKDHGDQVQAYEYEYKDPIL